MKQAKNFTVLIFLLLYAFSIKGQQILEHNYDNLDKALKKDFRSGFGFSVLVGDEKKILFNKSYGYIDLLKTKSTNERTLFNIASISKSITTIGIMRLIEQNKLNLTDTLGKFFSNVPSDKRTITISNLLCHKSGFQQNYVCDGKINSNEALQALLADTLGSIAGTNFDYSNQNFEMLALVIEKIANTTYEAFIRKEILSPLKMKNTYFWDEVRSFKNVAEKNRTISDSIMMRNWGYIGSGGIYSTSTDLYKFMNGVIQNRLISKSSLQLLFSEYHKTKSGLGIGYGWFINDTTEWSSKEIWTRGNEDWGHNAVIRWFTDKKKIIIVCTNSGEISGDKQVTGNRLISNYIADYLWKREQN